MPFQTTPAPTETIWGKADIADQLLPGVWRVTTASHGGIVLSAERQAAMPDALRLEHVSYEEDVDWSLVVFAFADEIRRSSRRGAALLADCARQSVRVWHPDRYEAMTGEAVPVNDSHVLKRRAAYQAVIGAYVSTSAYGDWADWVPKGKVGVVGRMVASVDASGFARYFGEPIYGLVDRARYDARGDVSTFDDLGALRIDGKAPVTKEVAP